MLVQHRLDGRIVALGRYDDAARAHHRLGDHGRDRVGPFALDERAQALHHPRNEFGLALALMAETVVMRAVGMQHARKRQVEAVVVGRQAGQRGRHERHAMIGLLTRDDLLLLGPAQRIVHVPGKLDLRVVGLRAGRGVEHLGDRHRRQLLELLGQLDGRLRALGGEQVIVGQGAQLLRRRLDQLFLAEAQPRAPQPRHALDIGLALGVVDEDALAALDHGRAHLAQLVQRRIGVEEGLHVPGLQVGQGRLGRHGRNSRLHFRVLQGVGRRRRACKPLDQAAVPS